MRSVTIGLIRVAGLAKRPGVRKIRTARRVSHEQSLRRAGRDLMSCPSIAAPFIKRVDDVTRVDRGSRVDVWPVCSPHQAPGVAFDMARPQIRGTMNAIAANSSPSEPLAKLVAATSNVIFEILGPGAGRFLRSHGSAIEF